MGVKLKNIIEQSCLVLVVLLAYSNNINPAELLIDKIKIDIENDEFKV